MKTFSLFSNCFLLCHGQKCFSKSFSQNLFRKNSFQWSYFFEVSAWR